MILLKYLVPLMAALLLGGEVLAETAAEETTAEPQVILNEEDRKVVEMLELLEIMELLKDIESVAALEEDP